MQNRRTRNDLLIVFKIVIGRIRTELNSSDIFSIAPSRTRGTSVKLRAPAIR